MPRMMKRDGPSPVAPINFNGMRIEAMHDYELAPNGEPGGYIAAYSETTNERLWLFQVYRTIYDGRETDVQDIYIVHLVMSKKGLKVLDEGGRRYLVNLQDMSVFRLN